MSGAPTELTKADSIRGRGRNTKPTLDSAASLTDSELAALALGAGRQAVLKARRAGILIPVLDGDALVFVTGELAKSPKTKA